MCGLLLCACPRIAAAAETTAAEERSSGGNSSEDNRRTGGGIGINEPTVVVVACPCATRLRLLAGSVSRPGCEIAIITRGILAACTPALRQWRPRLSGVVRLRAKARGREASSGDEGAGEESREGRMQNAEWRAAVSHSASPSIRQVSQGRVLVGRWPLSRGHLAASTCRPPPTASSCPLSNHSLTHPLTHPLTHSLILACISSALVSSHASHRPIASHRHSSPFIGLPRPMTSLPCALGHATLSSALLAPNAARCFFLYTLS